MNSNWCHIPWFLLITLGVFVGLVRQGSAVESNVRQVSFTRLRTASKVSADFRQEAGTAVAAIPDGVWQELKDGGWEVRVATFVVDAAPSLRGVHPRGWPVGATWEQTDAVHLPSQRLLVFAEKRRDSDGRIVQNSRVSNVIRHEVGHAFDRAIGEKTYQSSDREFVAAYYRDVSRIPASEHEVLSYYLQKGSGGRQEAFAEAFAIQLGGGSDSKQQALFLKRFPNVVAHVKNEIRIREQPRVARN